MLLTFQFSSHLRLLHTEDSKNSKSMLISVSKRLAMRELALSWCRGCLRSVLDHPSKSAWHPGHTNASTNHLHAWYDTWNTHFHSECKRVRGRPYVMLLCRLGPDQLRADTDS